MATKLYLLSAANPLTGTFPASEQSSQTASWSMTGASSLLAMRGTKGTVQGSFSGASLASTSPQVAFCGYFASDTLNVDQSVGGAGQTLTINIANRETSLNMNFGSDLRCNVYVWRPSTGAKVGTICDCVVMTGGAEPSGSALTKVNNATTTATSTVSALAGDVIICEIWQFHTQGAASSYTGSVYANGTIETLVTNTTVTSHASFISFSADTLTFGTPASSGIIATLSVTLAADSAASLADVDVSAQLSVTVQNDSAASASDVDVSGSLSASLQNDTLSSSAGLVAADISATLDVTLQSDGLSAQSLASVSATGSLVNAGDSAAVQAKTAVSASSALNMQADSTSSTASSQVSASSDIQLASDQASSSASSNIVAGLSTTLIGDTSASFGTVFVSAESANQDLDDSASSELSADISADAEVVVAADIMTASVSVGGELTPSIERTLYIGAQSRNNVIDIQRRTSAQVAQSRSVAFESQNRRQTLIAQNRSAAPEPQNRNITE